MRAINIIRLIIIGFFTAGLSIAESYINPINEYTKNKDCFFQRCVCIPVAKRPDDYVKHEIVLSYPKSTNKRQVKLFMDRYGLTFKQESYIAALGKKLLVMGTKGKDAFDLIQMIAKQPSAIDSATNNLYKVETNKYESIDVHKQGNYALNITGVKQAHEFSRGKNIVIGMIDTPVDLNHHALRGKITQDYVTKTVPLSFKYLRHGTSIAGVLVGSDSEIGIAPDAKVYAVSAFSASPKTKGLLRSTSSDIIKAIQRVIDKKVDILNMSFVGSRDSVMAEMISRAHRGGMEIVAASGNDGLTKKTYPAALSEVIAVTAIDHNKRLYDKANRGDYIRFSAPGVGIVSTSPGNRYRLVTGTSIAAAHVSGALALLNAPGRSLDQLFVLTNTAADLGSKGRDSLFGYGLVNVFDALRKIIK